MSTRKKAVEELPLPAQDALPPSAFGHPTLHMILNAYVGGTGKRTLVTKFGLSAAYINAVIYEYLEKYDT